MMTFSMASAAQVNMVVTKQFYVEGTRETSADPSLRGEC